jgi:hypothetical protein
VLLGVVHACLQVDVAAWLVLLAGEHHEVELVRSTLSSLLATSRWELLNAGKGVVMHEVVFDLLTRLAAHALAASEDSKGERCSDSSTNSSAGSNCSSTGVAQTGTDVDQPLLPAAEAATAAAASTSAQGAGGGVDAARRAALYSLGRELLQPQLLGQLLHVAQGLGPWRLLTLVELVDWWGLGAGTSTQQQQQQVGAEALEQQPATGLAQQQAGQQVQPVQELAAQEVGGSAGGAAQVQQLGRASLEQQQQQQLSAQLKQRHTSSEDDSAALRDNLPVPRSSSGASLSSSGTANGSSSSVTSSCNGSGDAACDIVSPCVPQPGSSAAARRVCEPSGGLATGNSMEVGSLSSDGCPTTQTWLDDLMSKAVPGSSNTSPAAAPGALQQQQQRQAQLQLQRQQLQLHVQQPQSPASPGEHKQLDLGKEWGGSWQQLTGQVAQLHMTSPKARTQAQHQCVQAQSSTRAPRQSFDYEQHVVQALRRQAQAGCDHLRRESAPGPARTTAAAGARQLRSALSQTPLVSAPRCPVHPYMQQLASNKQQQQEQQ